MGNNSRVYAAEIRKGKIGINFYITGGKMGQKHAPVQKRVQHEHVHKHAPGKKCPSCVPMRRPWYRERLYQIGIATAVVLGLSYAIPALSPWFNSFLDYASMIWWAVLLGLFLGGIIDYFVPEGYIRKYLSVRKKRTIIYSVVLGFLMSACSHGILAIAMELYKKGASAPAVVAFLLASPWANLTMAVVLFGFFGMNALWIIAASLVIAIVTGFVFLWLEGAGRIEQNPAKGAGSAAVSLRKVGGWKTALSGTIKGSWALTKMVLWWILIGMLAASFASAFIPAVVFQQYLGPTILGLGITLVLAAVIEVCSEGSAPLAFEIYRQTGATGNSFVFLNAGVATDYTEIGLIWSNIGKRTAVWLPIVTVPQILVAGWLFNFFLV